MTEDGVAVPFVANGTVATCKDEVRWVMRAGDRVLQQLWLERSRIGGELENARFVWVDVPTVDEDA